MKQIYTPELEAQVQRRLRVYEGLALLAAVLCLCCGIYAAVRVTAASAAVMAALTGAVGLGIYGLIQRRFLPLFRADRLMKGLDEKEPEAFSGIYLGLCPEKSMRGGVMMYRLRLDEGKKVRKESVARELYLPAAFTMPDLSPSTPISGQTAEGVIVALTEPLSLQPAPGGGRYHVSARVAAGILCLAVLLWGGIYEAADKQSGGTIRMAVCTPAHHEESGLILEEELALEDTAVSISYTNTLESETVALYLATFGVSDADILVLNAEQFSGVFDNEGYPLDAQVWEQALGFAPRFLTDEAGSCTGLILYDPDDPDYSAHFSRLTDWIAVEKDAVLTVFIRVDSDYGENGQAQQVLTRILERLCAQ